MKKMMMMALVMGLVGVASAATLNWGSNTMRYVKADGTFYTGAQIAAGVGGSVVLVYVPTGAAVSPSGILNVTDAKSGRVTGAEGWTWTGVSNPAGEVWVTGDQFAVKFRKTDLSIVDLVYTDGANKGKVVADIFTLPGIANNAYLGTFTFGSLGNFTAVPEPTSMALIALGLAAVGLRRKFRA